MKTLQRSQIRVLLKFNRTNDQLIVLDLSARNDVLALLNAKIIYKQMDGELGITTAGMEWLRWYFLGKHYLKISWRMRKPYSLVRFPHCPFCGEPAILEHNTITDSNFINLTCPNAGCIAHGIGIAERPEDVGVLLHKWCTRYHASP